MTRYIHEFNENKNKNTTTTMFLKNKNKNFLKNYNKIRTKIEKLMGKDFNTKPTYGDDKNI